MSLSRPIHWFHARADLIWPVGPFKVCRVNYVILVDLLVDYHGQRVRLFHCHKNTDTVTTGVYF